MGPGSVELAKGKGLRCAAAAPSEGTCWVRVAAASRHSQPIRAPRAQAPLALEPRTQLHIAALHDAGFRDQLEAQRV